jgi:SIR2-like domain
MTERKRTPAGSSGDATVMRPFAIYILGAGFSKPAGLPLATELWGEVYRRAAPLTGRMAQFREDLEDFIKFKAECDGVQLSPDQVNYEEFLGYLDIEYHLELRGSDTWSDDGNEAQVVAKTLIGQVIAERMPSKKAIPQLYLNFVRKLQPGDTIFTFNYDVLLEHALEVAGVPFRLFPHRYTSISHGGGGTLDWSSPEVVVYKLHGSIDWFDRHSYTNLEADWKARGLAERPKHPIFNGPLNLKTTPLIDGVSHPEDSLRETYRVIDFQRFYSDPPWFLAVPKIINPSTAKVIFARQFSDFFYGLGKFFGANYYKFNIIGFSMSEHDEYARQVIYRIVKNYLTINVNDPPRPKDPIRLVDYPPDESARSQLLKRYAFLDPAKSEFLLDGFDEATVERL